MICKSTDYHVVPAALLPVDKLIKFFDGKFDSGHIL